MKLSSDDLPMFFTEAHGRLADRLRAVAPAIAAVDGGAAIDAFGVPAPVAVTPADEAARDRAAAAALAEAGLFALVVPRAGEQEANRSGDQRGGDDATSAAPRDAGPRDATRGGVNSPVLPAKSPVGGKISPLSVDLRAVCLAREMLAYVSPRADSILVCQGLGTYAIGAAGSAEQRAELPAFARGARIAALALTEPEAGSDVAAIATRATPAGDGYRLDGDKLFISNLGIADHAMVVATVDPARGHAGLTAFWLPLDAPGVTVRPLAAIAAHPIGALALRGVAVPASARIGEEGQGMKLGLDTLDAFRVSVGAAAVGMARRAFDEALGFVSRRSQFGKLLSEQPLVQAHLADMIVDLDAARLLVLRAAYLKDTTGEKRTTEVSIGKLGATEAAQRVIDRAVQLLGGRGVMAGAVVEQLYRAIRPLRIYEGTSEIQRTIIGRALARQGRGG
ncbi:MAG: acyl-CoA dehydrogenase [Deltaproteobacteria bacterium]|nr:MAG: acyl-CoA dehydrogenase [Deltaproteobacteria bacterium]